MSKYFPSLESFAKGTFATAATLSTVGFGLLYYGQNYLIYPSSIPQNSRIEVDTPDNYGLPYEDLELQTSDGELLRCFLLTQRKDSPPIEASTVPEKSDMTEDEFIASRPTVIMFHGNGGNHGHRIPLARIFYNKMRCNVLMVSYRGYGLSTGSPSEKGLKIDAQTALDYLTSNPTFSTSPIILYGQSIGGAVSVDLASRNPSKIGALILENTFTSLPNVIPYALPLLGPFSFLCHEKWESINKIPLIPATTPILMLSGLADKLVPPEHMRTLWEAIAKRGEKTMGGGVEYKVGLERAKYMEFEHGDHNNTCIQHGYWQAVSDFVSSVVADWKPRSE